MNRWTCKGRADIHHIFWSAATQSDVFSYNSNYYCPSIDMSFIPVLELAAVETSRLCSNASIYFVKYITCNVQFLI